MIDLDVPCSNYVTGKILGLTENEVRALAESGALPVRAKCGTVFKFRFGDVLDFRRKKEQACGQTS